MAVRTLRLRLGLITELVGFLTVPFGHRTMALRLGLQPLHFSLAGDPSPLHDLPDGEQHHRHDYHCDNDDHDC